MQKFACEANCGSGDPQDNTRSFDIRKAEVKNGRVYMTIRPLTNNPQKAFQQRFSGKIVLDIQTN